jgi:hypothetical protein
VRFQYFGEIAPGEQLRDVRCELIQIIVGRELHLAFAHGIVQILVRRLQLVLAPQEQHFVKDIQIKRSAFRFKKGQALGAEGA